MSRKIVMTAALTWLGLASLVGGCAADAGGPVAEREEKVYTTGSNIARPNRSATTSGNVTTMDRDAVERYNLDQAITPSRGGN